MFLCYFESEIDCGAAEAVKSINRIIYYVPSAHIILIEPLCEKEEICQQSPHIPEGNKLEKKKSIRVYI